MLHKTVLEQSASNQAQWRSQDLNLGGAKLRGEKKIDKK